MLWYPKHSIPIFTNAGLEVRKYRYYDNESCDLDFDNLIGDMKAMPEGSCILLHACAHNPTGMDPTPEQWTEISKVAMEKNLLPFFDCAYQGKNCDSHILNEYLYTPAASQSHLK